MAVYYWLPFRCDTVWAPYFTHAAEGGAPQHEAPAVRADQRRWDRDSERYWSEDDRGEWSQVRATDTVKIVTHGRKFSTKEVAWLCQDLPAGLISWTAPEMAAVLKQLTNHVQGPLEWDLLACFGANMWGLSKSFASRLHEEMLKLGMDRLSGRDEHRRRPGPPDRLGPLHDRLLHGHAQGPHGQAGQGVVRARQDLGALTISLAARPV